MFITLTTTNGHPFHAHRHGIAAIKELDGRSAVYLPGVSVEVEETFEEIQALLNPPVDLAPDAAPAVEPGPELELAPAPKPARTRKR